MGRAVNESDRHRRAFEIYYALGEKRTIAEVARRVGVNDSAVFNWSAAFQWKKRVEERERLVGELLAEQVIEEEVQSRNDALKICRAVQLRYAEKLKLGKAIIEAGDFANVVKLELLLRGKATSRAEHLLGGDVVDRLIDALSAVIEREVQDPAIRAKLAAGFQEAAASTVGHA